MHDPTVRSQGPHLGSRTRSNAKSKDGNLFSDARMWRAAFKHGISVASGMIVPALSLFFGKIFDYFTRFGAGQINGHDPKQGVSSYARYLVGLGCASGLLNACFYLLWMKFGELQAMGARKKFFNGMIEKEMEWYDRLVAVIGTYSSRLQS